MKVNVETKMVKNVAALLMAELALHSYGFGSRNKRHDTDLKSVSAKSLFSLSFC